LNAGETVQFTFFWLEQKTWEGKDYEVLFTE
jgi:glucoamylase